MFQKVYNVETNIIRGTTDQEGPKVTQLIGSVLNFTITWLKTRDKVTYIELFWRAKKPYSDDKRI